MAFSSKILRNNENIKFLERHKDDCAQIIKKQGLVFWTRWCIKSRCQTRVAYGGAYIGSISDQIVVDLLRKFDSKGEDKVISFIFSTMKVAEQRELLPNIETIINSQKTSARAAMKKCIEEVFPSKLLKEANDLLQDGVASPHELEMLKGKFLQGLVVCIYLADHLCLVLRELKEKNRVCFKWEVPDGWRAPSEYLPLDLEEYLRDKWRSALATEVLGLKQEEISWWNRKRPVPLQLKTPGTLPRIYIAERQIATKLQVPDFLLFDGGPSLHDILIKRDGSFEQIVKNAPVDTNCKLLFQCYEQMVPPVLASKYHVGRPLLDTKAVVSAWFGTWCTVMDGTTLPSIVRNQVPGMSASLQDHLKQMHNTLIRWGPPAETDDSDLTFYDDMFLELPEVVLQFCLNPTIRLQWLAVALAIVMKFEIEASPLQFWPMPAKYVKDVTEVLSLIKVTKEGIILGLRTHDEKNMVDLQSFQKNMLPMLVHNVNLMKSPMAKNGVRGLRSKCKFTFDGITVPKGCWMLNKDLLTYYKEHPWNFQYHNSWTDHKYPKKSNFNEDMRRILDDWRSDKGQKSQQDEKISLLTNDVLGLLKRYGWTKKGLFVRQVVGAIVEMGFVMKKEAERVLKKDLVSPKFDAPMSGMTGGAYSSMDFLGQMSCHCLVLIQCATKFRGKGKILHGKPKTLVGNLVLLSLQLFELEHMHSLAYLAGQFCDFDPVSPYSCKPDEQNTNFDNFVKELVMRRRAGTFQLMESDPQIKFAQPEPGLLELGQKQNVNWLIKKLQRLQIKYQTANHDKLSVRGEGALLQYLFPYYLSALPSTDSFEHSTVVFFYKVLKRMFEKFEVVEGAAPLKLSQRWEVKSELLLTLNKILQMCNAFVDRGSGRVTKNLADMFMSTCCIFEENSKINNSLLTHSFTFFASQRNHFRNLFEIIVEEVELSAQLLAWRNPSLVTPAMAMVYVYHCITLDFASAIEAFKEEENLDKKILAALVPLRAAEDAVQWWRSMMYLRLTVVRPNDGFDEQFFKEAEAVFKNLWQAMEIPARGIEGIDADDQLTKLNKILSTLKIADSNGTVAPSLLREWKESENSKYDMSSVNQHQQQFPASDFPSSAFAASASLPNLDDDFEDRKKTKVKKYLKPSKAVLSQLEQQKKDKERRVCKMCKKKEGNKKTFITCAECIKTKFPKVAHYCSKICEKQAWESFHDEKHTLFELELYDPSDDES